MPELLQWEFMFLLGVGNIIMKLLSINYNVTIENMQMPTLQMIQGAKKSGNVQIKSELKNKFYLTLMNQRFIPFAPQQSSTKLRADTYTSTPCSTAIGEANEAGSSDAIDTLKTIQNDFREKLFFCVNFSTIILFCESQSFKFQIKIRYRH